MFGCYTGRLLGVRLSRVLATGLFWARSSSLRGAAGGLQGLDDEKRGCG